MEARIQIRPHKKRNRNTPDENTNPNDIIIGTTLGRNQTPTKRPSHQGFSPRDHLQKGVGWVLEVALSGSKIYNFCELFHFLLYISS